MVKEIQIKTYGFVTSDCAGQDLKKPRNLNPVKRETPLILIIIALYYLQIFVIFKQDKQFAAFETKHTLLNALSY